MVTGNNPINPIRLWGNTRAISEPAKLTTISDPIPIYCPRTIWEEGNLGVAKNTISMNKSYMLVDTNAALPTPTRAGKSNTISCEHQVKEATYIDLSFLLTLIVLKEKRSLVLWIFVYNSTYRFRCRHPIKWLTTFHLPTPSTRRFSLVFSASFFLPTRDYVL